MPPFRTLTAALAGCPAARRALTAGTAGAGAMAAPGDARHDERQCSPRGGAFRGRRRRGLRGARVCVGGQSERALPALISLASWLARLPLAIAPDASPP